MKWQLVSALHVSLFWSLFTFLFTVATADVLCVCYEFMQVPFYLVSWLRISETCFLILFSAKNRSVWSSSFICCLQASVLCTFPLLFGSICVYDLKLLRKLPSILIQFTVKWWNTFQAKSDKKSSSLNLQAYNVGTCFAAYSPIYFFIGAYNITDIIISDAATNT